jgi:hypothetical protein
LVSDRASLPEGDGPPEALASNLEAASVPDPESIPDPLLSFVDVLSFTGVVIDSGDMPASLPESVARARSGELPHAAEAAIPKSRNPTADTLEKALAAFTTGPPRAAGR